MTTITIDRALLEQALEALTPWMDSDHTVQHAAYHALRAALAQQAEPVQEPWATRERFYEAVDRAVENVRQEMKVKTVTMRLPEYDITMPIIDAFSGHVLVGPVVPAPPQRKPLTDEEIDHIDACIDKFTPLREGKRLFARAVERALEEKNRGR